MAAIRSGAPPALSISVAGATLKRVALDDLEPSRPMRADLGERAERARVALDGDHLPRPLRQKRARQAAGAGSDLDHGDACERPGGAGDLSGQVEIEQEVLAERLAGVKPVRAPTTSRSGGRPSAARLIASIGRRA